MTDQYLNAFREIYSVDILQIPKDYGDIFPA